MFTSWNEVQPLVSGFPDAKFKSFDLREDAER
ncbi:RNase H1/viroplasmin domain-containing protein [bacterium]|nr:RNase H1/viroplasmin domain-containing protein [bacterium]